MFLKIQHQCIHGNGTLCCKAIGHYLSGYRQCLRYVLRLRSREFDKHGRCQLNIRFIQLNQITPLSWFGYKLRTLILSPYICKIPTRICICIQSDKQSKHNSQVLQKSQVYCSLPNIIIEFSLRVNKVKYTYTNTSLDQGAQGSIK